MDLVRQSTSANVKIVIVGNKKDLESERQVDKSKAEELVKNSELFAYAETSAKTGERILEIFMKLASVLIKECSDKETHDGIKLGDEINDDELIEFRKSKCEEKCQGSLEYLEDTALAEYARWIRRGCRN